MEALQNRAYQKTQSTRRKSNQTIDGNFAMKNRQKDSDSFQNSTKISYFGKNNESGMDEIKGDAKERYHKNRAMAETRAKVVDNQNDSGKGQNIDYIMSDALNNLNVLGAENPFSQIGKQHRNTISNNKKMTRTYTKDIKSFIQRVSARDLPDVILDDGTIVENPNEDSNLVSERINTVRINEKNMSSRRMLNPIGSSERSM